MERTLWAIDIVSYMRNLHHNQNMSSLLDRSKNEIAARTGRKRILLSTKKGDMIQNRLTFCVCTYVFDIVTNIYQIKNFTYQQNNK